MNNLTEQWKAGKVEALDELINQIATVDDSRSLSDEYLKEKGLMTRGECGVAAEYPYGIVMVISDYVLPYMKKLQALKEENQQLKKQINHLLKTQARQFIDNQKLQVKAEKAKDVVNIDTARQIKQLKELLKRVNEHFKWVDFDDNNYVNYELWGNIKKVLGEE